MKKILVIGNGFDLAHGLKTGYVDFLDWFKDIIAINDENTKNPRETNEELPKIQQEKPDVYEEIIAAKDNFWIAYFNEKRDQVGDKWLNFESEIEVFTKKAYSEINITGLETTIENLKKEFPDKVMDSYVNKEDLFQWLFEQLRQMTRILEIYLYTCKNITKAITNKKQLFENIEAKMLLSFNYTSTYQDVYNADITTNYIHGKADIDHNDNCNLVLGFDDHYFDTPENNISELIPFEKYYQRIVYRNSNEYFQWVEDIEEKEIHFYGHSLSPADGDIIKLLIESKNAKTFIYYREGKEQDRAEIIKNLAIILKPDGLIKRMGGSNPTIEFKPVAKETLLDLAVSYLIQGEIKEYNGNIGEAKEYYNKSLDIWKRLATDTYTVEVCGNLAKSYGKLGDIAKTEGNIAEAKGYYNKALAITEQLAAETNTIEARYNLAISYGKLGDIAEAEGDNAEEKDYYNKALAIFEQLAAETNTVEARRNLAVSYNKLGYIAKAEGNIAEAKEYYNKSLAISKQLAAETNTIEARRDLATSNCNLGVTAKDEGNNAESKEYYNKALAIFKQLAAETNTVKARRDLAICYVSLSDIAKDEGNNAESKENFNKSLAIFEQLVTETNTVEARKDLAVIYISLYYIAEAEGNNKEAKQYYKKLSDIKKLL